MGLKSSAVISSHIGYEKLMFELCCVVNFEVITHRITIWVSPLKTCVENLVFPTCALNAGNIKVKSSF